MLKPMLKLILVLMLVAANLVVANELPTLCSRDKNINEFTILSYHEIAAKGETLNSTYTVTPENFEEQIRFLMDNGYHFVSVDDILEYRKNAKPLPDKAVLLTFDDGYQSVYANAFPIIKKYKIPTVVALVGSWLKSKERVDFDGHMIDRSKFLSKEEIKEMISSGLVEIASHTYALHKGILGNPYGNKLPAVKAREWLEDKQMYENERSYEKRVHDDLLQSATFLKGYIKQRPRVIVWPYGYYNKKATKIAEKLGMFIGLTLDDGSNTKNTPLNALRRILVEGKMDIADLKLAMAIRDANFTDDARATKAAHIDLDYIYDEDPQQREKNLGALLDRINNLGINTVYLQAFGDPDANGAADFVYFANRHVPMRADFFNRVSWQIKTRTHVSRVYAWMPMIAWQLPSENPAAKDMVVTLQVDSTHLNMGYPRLSPFSSKAQKVIKEIYEDLAKSTFIDGILFHDDVTLSDYEDDSKAARAQYKKWGLSQSVNEIRADKVQFAKWTKLKTEYLDNFAMELAQILRDEQPGIKTARNLYAQVALNENAQEWYAQSLSESIKKYDYTAIMAMPYMEQAENHTEFYDNIVKHVKEDECGLERTVMELQSVDWRKDSEPISSKELSQTIEHLYDLGVHHIAYYPDNLYKNNPDADVIREDFAKKDLRMHTITPSFTAPNN
ncbi:MAG: poly-beta-1,6-N-acetyl-D-glucosamine N-deacetylase PgaB [Sulfurimonas sp. RIFOXYD12_FULL_33_39]|uniref:poly-beta-1,6-N-acetyl-D-glucosamine N-deacetylase PgaB n=1 Tax=unclassified Sulfurimonas TaxID=2623549 RepID=UPI0008D42366|nr:MULTISPECIES: poly-beta-1,6-N-acetyl-D-glucosamine N-deacetylase PgaB [unclassified Sulfurimonas]OHE08982.1 MAG: poly-beta-1,6-N-acetyl-D-glucosamine N-deacetylase PgaB [Sulfurimonas sp. RIFOXYD12_FULL_33_39]OHE14292.1 MAG: poly-beta-1,6-N-acetyl-D-glucosamine N-deacetylase PgaB [Sulfurimonas sp. RIFOXYD2_FULL_34_21]